MKKLFLFMSWVMLILSGCADEDIIDVIPRHFHKV